jgi:site-specific DNA-methyltransferase (adenine-specific)
MSLARLRSVVLLLANNGYCRYWTHWNHPIDDPWEMAVSLLYSAWAFPVTKSGAMKHEVGAYGGESITGFLRGKSGPSNQHGDSGSAARFFYCAKSSKSDRDDGLAEFAAKPSAASEFRPNHTEKAAEGEDGNTYGRWKPLKNNHPTVKPTDLMRYLCRLVTPPGGKVLDPFAGSGSTGRGAVLEGFQFIGIEIDEGYFDIACKRIEKACAQPDMFVETSRNPEAKQADIFGSAA